MAPQGPAAALGPRAAAERVSTVVVAVPVVRRAFGAEEGAQADLSGTLSDERVDDEEVRYDDGNEGLATSPSAAGGGSVGTGLSGLG